MNKRRQNIFENLLKDAKVFEQQNVKDGKKADHENKVPSTVKAHSALQYAQEENATFETLFEEICKTLDSVSTPIFEIFTHFISSNRIS